ncbi:hypothetical protein NQ314_009542 [Rhamnusium bicolor]|uniref:Uncharacterized protein n=1 Tax=Rhamnusium bicolor TaxID=1586634 RepID=A0AAV8XYH6_9CUCU|nr:hypothetical protein NQ314_009542 [Rhamnusium bicolor]
MAEALEESLKIFFFGHCNIIMGPLNYIIEKDIPTKHICFTRYGNVNVDFGTKKSMAVKT